MYELNTDPAASIYQHPEEILSTETHISDTIIVTAQRSGKIIVWAVDRRDISDASFAIAGSLPLLPTIVFDTLRVGHPQDTTLMAFTNTTGSTLLINKVIMKAGDTADFKVITGNGPLDIAPGAPYTIGIQFNPRDRGFRKATVEVQTSAGSVSGELRGNALKGALSYLVSLVDLGQRNMGEVVDTTIATAKNFGDGIVRIDSITRSGIGNEQFTIVEGATVPFELQPGEKYVIRVQFTPGRSNSILSLNLWDEYKNIAHVTFVAAPGVSGVPSETPAVTGVHAIIKEIYPNPVRTSLSITLYPGIRDPLNVKMLNMSGETVMDKTVGISYSGDGSIPLDVSALPMGKYWMVVTQGAETDVRTVMIQR